MLESIRCWWTFRGITHDWVSFREWTIQKLGSAEVTPADEEDFLRLKGRIAARIPRLEASIADAYAQDAREQFAEMKSLLNRYRTLRAATPLSAQDREEVDQEWHRHFLFLSSLKGAVRAPRRESLRSGGIADAGYAWNAGPRRRRRVGGSFALCVRLMVVAIVLYALARVIGLRKGEAGSLVFQPPSSFQGVVSNLVDASKSVGGMIGNGLSPVIAAYGVEVTVVLVGVLVLGIGYLTLARG
jgi:hypothetical protein